jgi:hypothetical protein
MPRFQPRHIERQARIAAVQTMKHPSENQTQEVLAGLVERVTYHNVENGFCVLRAKARGHRDVVTVVGHAAAIAAGEWITASGEWVNDRTLANRRALLVEQRKILGVAPARQRPKESSDIGDVVIR